MLRGDSHRLFCRLRRIYPTPPRGPLRELNHVREIAEYYAGLDPRERLLLLAWAKKEESGLGLIPAALSGIPLLGLIFTPFMEHGIRSMPAWTWMLLWLVGALMLTAGIYIHYRQKAWSTLHVRLLEQFVKEKP